MAKLFTLIAQLFKRARSKNRDCAIPRIKYLKNFIGCELIAYTDLTPTGWVITPSDEIIDAISEYGVIPKGQKVKVIDSSLWNCLIVAASEK